MKKSVYRAAILISILFLNVVCVKNSFAEEGQSQKESVKADAAPLEPENKSEFLFSVSQKGPLEKGQRLSLRSSTNQQQIISLFPVDQAFSIKAGLPLLFQVRIEPSLLASLKKSGKHNPSDLLIKFSSPNHIKFNENDISPESGVVSAIVTDKDYASKIIYITAELHDKNTNEILGRSMLASVYGRQFINFNRNSYQSQKIEPGVPVNLRAIKQSEKYKNATVLWHFNEAEDANDIKEKLDTPFIISPLSPGRHLLRAEILADQSGPLLEVADIELEVKNYPISVDIVNKKGKALKRTQFNRNEKFYARASLPKYSKKDVVWKWIPGRDCWIDSKAASSSRATIYSDKPGVKSFTVEASDKQGHVLGSKTICFSVVEQQEIAKAADTFSKSEKLVIIEDSKREYVEPLAIKITRSCGTFTVGDQHLLSAKVTGGRPPYTYYWNGTYSGSDSYFSENFKVPGFITTDLVVYDADNRMVSTRVTSNVKPFEIRLERFPQYVYVGEELCGRLRWPYIDYYLGSFSKPQIYDEKNLIDWTYSNSRRTKICGKALYSGQTYIYSELNYDNFTLAGISEKKRIMIENPPIQLNVPDIVYLGEKFTAKVELPSQVDSRFFKYFWSGYDNINKFSNTPIAEYGPVESEGNVNVVLEVRDKKGRLVEKLSKRVIAKKSLQALEENRKKAETLWREGAALKTSGDYEGALVKYEKSLEFVDDADVRQIIIYLKKLIVGKKKAESLWLEGAALRSSGDYEGALLKYRSSLEYIEDADVRRIVAELENLIAGKKQAESLWREAAALKSSGNYIEALAKYREGLEIFEDANTRKIVSDLEALIALEAEKQREAQEQKQREAEEQKQREAEEQKQREAEEQKQREAEEQKQREAEEQKQREAEEQKQREAEEQKQREAQEQKQREAEEQKQREAEEQKQREAEEQKQREAEEQKQREAQEQKQREAEEQKQREAEEQKQREAQEQKQREAQEQKQREAQEQKQREAQEQKQREAEEQKQREAEERKQREAQEQKQREAEEQKQREAQEQKQREAEEQKQREAEEQKQREAEEQKQREAQEQKQRETEEQKQREAEERKQRETEEQKQREAQEQKQREAEEQKQREAQEQKQREAEKQKQREAQEQKQRETEEQKQRETEEQKQRETEEQKQREAQEQKQRETEEQKQREAEERRQREAQEQKQREAEERRQREAQEQKQREAEERRQREAQEQKQRETEEQKQREAEEQKQREVQEQRQREAQEQKQREAEERRQREAQEQKQREAEERRQREAQEQKQREAEERRQREAQEQKQREAEERRQREAQEQKQREAEERRQREAQEQRQREAQEQRQREAQEQRQREAQEQRQREAQEQRQREAQEQKQREAEERRQREAQEQKQREAEERKQREAQEQKQREAEEQKQREAQEQKQREAQEQKQREAQEQKQREAEGEMS